MALQKVFELLNLGRRVGIQGTEPAVIDRDRDASIASSGKQRQTVLGTVVGESVSVVAD